MFCCTSKLSPRKTKNQRTKYKVPSTKNKDEKVATTNHHYADDDASGDQSDLRRCVEALFWRSAVVWLGRHYPFYGDCGLLVRDPRRQSRAQAPRRSGSDRGRCRCSGFSNLGRRSPTTRSGPA